MATVNTILSELKKLGTEQTRKTLARHGATENVFGVSVANLKVLAKTIKGEQQLAYDLYATGNVDAMYLAGMVADGSQMTKKQLQDWAKTAEHSWISEYIVPWVAIESQHGRNLAIQWMKSKRESIASSGWATYAGLLAVTADEDLDQKEIQELLDRIEKDIHNAANRVRYTMNGFVIAVGISVEPLLEKAKTTATAIGAVSVDMGDTACKVPLATAYIQKAETAGRVGKKRKTIKC